MPRTPKFFDGTRSPSKPIGEELERILSEIGRQVGFGGDEIVRAWPDLLGPKFAPLTEALGVQNGVLTVKVKSSTLYSLLRQHEKPRLLARLQERFPRAAIRDIVFRIGS